MLTTAIKVFTNGAAPGARPAPASSRKPVLVACRSCGHVWPVFFQPLDPSLLGDISPKVCPMCAAPARQERSGRLGIVKSGIVLATREFGDLDRYVTWLERELARARQDAALSLDQP
ncbi:MAG: hypothetical protein WCF85_22510, partial [Rhodospirillaceae bacterium]